MSFDRSVMRSELERDEGRKRFPYRDTRGYLTIGCGWNLDSNGLPDDIIDSLLDRSIDRACATLDVIEPRWRSLDEPRQRVLVNMAFNLGPLGIAKFKRFWAAIGEYLSGGGGECLERAADEMQRSAWAGQVGQRAQRLIEVMRGL